jgi:hypothetical protein
MGRASMERHDGFILRKARIDLPFGINTPHAELQRDLLICHLFANNRYSTSEIAGRFGLDNCDIIDSLLAQRVVVFDRRQIPTICAAQVQPEAEYNIKSKFFHGRIL